MPIPNRTPVTPARNKISTTGIWIKLWMYLNFSIVIVPVNGSAANPFDKRREITKNRKKTRNGIEFLINPLTDRFCKDSSSIVFIRYKRPFIRARNNTANPNARFRKLSKASRPYQDVAQWTPFIWLSENIEPVKKVATATPIRKGPREPLRKRNMSNVFWPKTLFGLDLNS